MKLTNKKNFPSPIVRAVTVDEHRGAEYSASMLKKSPRMVWLDRRHRDEISEDVSERIFSLIGKACHYITEKTDAPNTLQEGYLEMEVCGRTLSGTFDIYEDDILSDLKTVSVYQVKTMSAREDWEAQTNVYAHLLRTIGFKPRGVQVIAIMRDWSMTQAARDPEFPQEQVALIPLRLWPSEEVQAYIEARIMAFEAHRETKDDALPECKADETWEKPSVFAVMKEGRKSAVKLHDDEIQADAHAATLGKGHSVIHRPGARTRCEYYCRVSQFCNQYARWKLENAAGGLGVADEQ